MASLGAMGNINAMGGGGRLEGAGIGRFRGATMTGEMIGGSLTRGGSGTNRIPSSDPSETRESSPFTDK